MLKSTFLNWTYYNTIPLEKKGTVQYLSSIPISGSKHKEPTIINNNSSSDIIGYSKFLNLCALCHKNNYFYLPQLNVSEPNIIYNILNISKKIPIYIYYDNNKKNKIKIEANQFRILIWNSYLLKWVNN